MFLRNSAVFEAIGLKNIIGAHSSCMLEGTAFAVGLPVIPSFMPASLGVTDDTSSFSTRVNNILFTFLSWYFQTSLAATAQGVMEEKLGSGITPIWKWKQILNLRPRTILISFGSVAPSITMPDAMKKAIVEVVKSYPDVTFIWKYEKPDDTFAAGVENLILSKWTPQADLLEKLVA
ncbi:hypothetical protein ANCDUO_19704 [Ancylostoma duodenale]|uniref:glucuronosyltransferase n=1 Tax=Ancylostoma duodenale TaxID=51022 RepID=A0A0C2FU67_9BILA|nr:hypothetical protein ANCDUO_19704 [Ancylostoma duodenale]